MATASAVDRRQPWLGLASYSETDSELFFGREKERLELLRRVRRDTLTVLFGPSGTGKTSLLRAGLFPSLREEALLPVPVRLDHSGEHPDYSGQVRALISAAIASSAPPIEEEALSPEPPAAAGPETLWEYLHRVVFWDSRNNPVTLVLVLDQFEEIFTLGRNPSAVNEFLRALADLVENHIPASVRQRMEHERLALPFPYEHPGAKVILSLREDYVWRLDSLRNAMPSVMHNRFAITRMNGEQALQAVEGPGRGIVESYVAERIVRFVAAPNRTRFSGNGDGAGLASLQLDPALLSVVCRELNAHRLEEGRDQITEDLIEKTSANILDDFYERSFAGLNPAVRPFVEDRLLTGSGFRSTVPMEEAAQAGFAEDIGALVDRRLLRTEDRLGIPHVELTHDLLRDVVLKSRAGRQERERAERAAARDRAEREELDRTRRELEERARTASKLRRLLFGLIAAGLIAIVAIVFALREIANAAHAVRIARELQRKASDASSAAKESREAAIAAQMEARRLQDEARQLKVTADSKTAEALNQQAIAESEKDSNRHLLYSANIKLAQQAYGAGDYPRVRELLATYLPDRAKGATEDLRGFEWYYLWHICPTAPRVLRQRLDGGGVSALAFSPDGKLLAASNGDSVSFWDAQNWSRTDLSPGSRPTPARSIAFSPDGRMLALLTFDKAIVFDVENKAQLDSFDVPQSGSGGGISFSPDSQILAAAAGSGIVLRDVNKRRELRPPLDLQALSVAFSPDGNILAAGTRQGLKLLSRSDWTDILGLAEERSVSFSPVAFSPDGKTLCVGRNGSVETWNRDQGVWSRLKDQQPIQHGNYVLSIAFSPDSTLIATGSDQAVAKLWDARTRREVKAPENLMRAPAHLRSVAFSPKGDTLAGASSDGGIRAWDLSWLRDQQPIARYEWAGFGSLAFSPDGRTIAVGRKDGVIQLLDGFARRPLRTVKAHTKEIRSMAYSLDGKRLATGSDDQTAKVWNAPALDQPLTFTSKGPFDFVALSPDGRSFVTGERYEPLRVWDTNSAASPLLELKGACDSPKSAIFVPNGKSILAGCSGGLRLFHRSNKAQLRVPEIGGSPSTIAISTGGETYAVAAGNEIVMWNAPESALQLKGHTGSVSALAFSPDNGRLASGSYDSTIKFWDIKSGQELATFKAEEGGSLSIITSLAFSPDGRKLLIGGMNGEIRLWPATGPGELTASPK